MLKQARQTLVTAPREGCGGAATCGSALAQGEPLPEALWQRIDNHPCYSEQAHHYFARMHLAVAPACNIQCHYCNRKYDCANESRPGVVSELLTPEQAVQKTLAVATAIPELAVVGIAGPGDPLANPTRTFATFRALSAQAPDLKLCVSTNGLALPAHVEELVKHNIGHVTITINCLDPDIGAKIYPWICWDHRRIRGRQAAEILIAQQLKGLEMLVARDVLVKINSVMIPGVNDEHLRRSTGSSSRKAPFCITSCPCSPDRNMVRITALPGSVNLTSRNCMPCERPVARNSKRCAIAGNAAPMPWGYWVKTAARNSVWIRSGACRSIPRPLWRSAPRLMRLSANNWPNAKARLLRLPPCPHASRARPLPARS